MSKNYIDFFGFNEQPFEKALDTDFYFASKSHSIAYIVMEQFINDDNERFAVLTGENGLGKSILVKQLVDHLPEQYIAINFICPLTKEETSDAVLKQFTLIEDGKKSLLNESFIDFIAQDRLADKKILLIIDDACSLQPTMLQELYATKSKARIKTLFVGLPDMLARLKASGIVDINKVVKADLTNFTRRESDEYIKYRLDRAGKNSTILPKSTLKDVYLYTGGNPSYINAIMERAIIAAFMDKTNKINKDHVLSALKSLNMPERPEIAKKGAGVLMKAVASIVLIFAAVGLFNIYQTAQELRITPKPDDQIAAVEPVTPDTTPKPTIEPVTGPIPQDTEPNITTPVVPQDTVVQPIKPTDEPTVEPIEPTIEPITPIDPPPTDAGIEATPPTDTPQPIIASITGRRVNVRAEPSTSAPVVASALYGEEFVVLEETSDWLLVELPDNNEGWIFKQFIAIKE